MITSETKVFGTISGLVALVVLAALGGMLLIIRAKDAAYEEHLAARAMRIATEQDAASLEDLVAETAEDREGLKRHMLDEDTVVAFLSLIEDLADASEVSSETRSLAVEAIKESNVFERLTLEVDATGSFASVIRMLELLESLPYQAQVRVVAIERASEAEAEMWHGAYRLYVTKYK